LESLKRAQLVELAKYHGIKANGKNVEMVEALWRFGGAGYEAVEEGVTEEWSVINEEQPPAREQEEPELDGTIRGRNAAPTEEQVRPATPVSIAETAQTGKTTTGLSTCIRELNSLPHPFSSPALPFAPQLYPSIPDLECDISSIHSRADSSASTISVDIEPEIRLVDTPYGSPTCQDPHSSPMRRPALPSQAPVTPAPAPFVFGAVNKTNTAFTFAATSPGVAGASSKDTMLKAKLDIMAELQARSGTVLPSLESRATLSEWETVEMPKDQAGFAKSHKREFDR